MLTQQGSVTAINGTVASSAVALLPGSSKVALTVTALNASAFTATLQGGPTLNGPWADTAITEASLNNVTKQVAPTAGALGVIPAVWAYYRVNVVGTGANTVTWRIVGLEA